LGKLFKIIIYVLDNQQEVLDKTKENMDDFLKNKVKVSKSSIKDKFELIYIN
jgi:hypothetical protein